MFEANRPRELSEQECLHLLGTAPIGRIVFTENALPAILPVNFALCEDGILLRTAAGGRLARVAEGTVVAFEADHFSDPHCDGWSVVALGRTRTLADTLARRAADRLRRCPWTPGVRPHYLRIDIEVLSGRRRGA